MLKRLLPDPYLILLLATVGLAAIVPVRGEAATGFGYVVKAAIAILFFLYGAKLPLQEVALGLRDWRLQGAVFVSTYGLFPALGILTTIIGHGLLSPELLTGILYLSVLPSTVQSSIAFTSIANGNVGAALTCATLSNLVGIFMAPILMALISGGGALVFDSGAVAVIAFQILLPFAVGQMTRPMIGKILAQHRHATLMVDRGAILLVVYQAFSRGMVQGSWSSITPVQLFWLCLALVLLLAFMLGLTTLAGRLLGLDRAARITVLFCGSKKSLATGIPMAAILFAGPAVAIIVLPLMLFHQLQLFVCATLAQQYARRMREAGRLANA
jgi:sodium/bile acid cotransporter 7